MIKKFFEKIVEHKPIIMDVTYETSNILMKGKTALIIGGGVA